MNHELRTLHLWQSSGLEANELVTCFSRAVRAPSIGIVTSPREVRLVEVDNEGKISGTWAGRPYDMRFFNRHGEARWWRPTDGPTRSVVLFESDSGYSLDEETWVRHEQRVVAIHDGRYLLWGKVATDRQNKVLSSARVGRLSLPPSLSHFADGQEVQLAMREYIGVCPQRGQAEVFEERLLGFIASEGTIDLSKKDRTTHKR
ncbi:MAG: hypothetical protein KDB23_17510 [Planctomycetales bacterium]|nr:hypothetical protein [Planctomycetales bacterium]